FEFEREDLLQAEHYDRILGLLDKPSNWVKASIKMIGMLEGNELVGLPKVPVSPAAEVRIAPKDVLESIFKPSGGDGVRIGSLITRDDVDVYLNPDEMVSRHLAILAVTGAGKSNTVSVILEEILRMGGVALLFDVHSEYTDIAFNCDGCHVESIRPQIDPSTLSLDELARLLAISYESAAKIYLYLKKAYISSSRLLRSGELGNYIRKAEIDADPNDMLAGIHAIVKLSLEEGGSSDDENLLQYDGRDENSVLSLLLRIEHVRERYSRVVIPYAGEIVDHLDYGKLVVVDLGNLDSELTDIVVGKTLLTLLHRAKAMRMGFQGRSIPIPVFTVLEEAHALIPSNERTYTSSAAAQIAKEGRKFGIGLCLVSQRPKGLNTDILSQMVNKIVLRVIEPDDQAYVRRTTEFLSEDMLDHLTSLDVGEAIIVGPMVRIPALVKIRLSGAKRRGESLRARELWRKGIERKNEEFQDDYYSAIGG
ncbi:MAG: ATP-binding protein, partial [Candidatus Korarchaeum sp.]